MTLHRDGEDGEDGDFVEDEFQVGLGKESVVRYVTRSGVARGFIMLKPMENYGYFTFQIAKNKCADQTARMRRLICAFVVRKQQSQRFSVRGSYDGEAKESWPPPGYAPEFQVGFGKESAVRYVTRMSNIYLTIIFIFKILKAPCKKPGCFELLNLKNLASTPKIIDWLVQLIRMDL